jgi:exodeoxyribonuclease VII large subunit
MAWNLTGTSSSASGSRSGARAGSGTRARSSSRSGGRASSSRDALGVPDGWTGSLFDPDSPASYADDADAANDARSGVSSNVPEPPRALTVTEALQVAKSALESCTLVVEGEVSECSIKSGYSAAYFTLADESSPMPCLMWMGMYRACGVELRKGIRVRVTGKFTVYTAKGRMQFQVNRIELAGEGDLRMRVARLSQKLQREGLMDDARKRPIPAFCQRVAVVTSPRGKAIHDVIRTLRRRNASVELLICGVPVEGEHAAQSIIEGLSVAQDARPDAILLVRGGGAYEDLMPFNDEALARAVASSPVPVVTGIGHEPDTTICDLVSDRRCSTPTAAAESIAPTTSELLSDLSVQASRIARSMQAGVSRRRTLLEKLCDRPVLTNPSQWIGQRRQMLDLAHDRLIRAIPAMVERREADADQASGRLARLGSALLSPYEAAVAQASGRLRRAGSQILNVPKHELAQAAGKLDALSPLAVIARGYAMALDADGHVVSHASDVSPGDSLDVRIQDATLQCEVQSVHAEVPIQSAAKPS